MPANGAQSREEIHVSTTLLWALGFIGASILMFVIAIPRNGEVVRFLRNRDGLQATYVITFLALMVVGIAVKLDYWW